MIARATSSRSRFIRLGAVLVGALFVLFMLWLVSYRREKPPFTLPIEDMFLGTPRDQSERVVANPRLLTKNSYSVDDPIALRMITTLPEGETFSLYVRVLTAQGTVQNLVPDTITATSGSSTFCCWQFDVPGTYTLQVFRAGERPTDELVLSLPLKIVTGSKKPPT